MFGLSHLPGRSVQANNIVRRTITPVGAAPKSRGLVMWTVRRRGGQVPCLTLFPAECRLLPLLKLSTPVVTVCLHGRA